MKDLEQFYDEVFKENGMPEFSELSPHHVKALETTLEFRVWKMLKSKSKFISFLLAPIKKLLYQ
jgi:hypothetical protein